MPKATFKGIVNTICIRQFWDKGHLVEEIAKASGQTNAKVRSAIDISHGFGGKETSWVTRQNNKRKEARKFALAQ